MNRNFKVRYNPQIYLDIQNQVEYYLQETGSHYRVDQVNEIVYVEAILHTGEDSKKWKERTRK